MASRFNTLYRGNLDEVFDLVDAGELSPAEVRAVLLNLIRRVADLEKKSGSVASVLDEALNSGDGTYKP